MILRRERLRDSSIVIGDFHVAIEKYPTNVNLNVTTNCYEKYSMVRKHILFYVNRRPFTQLELNGFNG